VAGRGSVKTWLLSIVHHRAIDAVRRRRQTTELPAEEDGKATPAPLTIPDVWGEVSAGIDREQVNAAVSTLPDAQREALELAYWAGLSQSEIADRLGVPLGTVKSRVRLALVALRRELGADISERAEGPP
jgi:RNA polymerase sigma-70 factor (ECF subfamily)